MPASTPAALALALLAGPPDVAALPPLPDCHAVQELIELPPEPGPQVHALCISPGIVTTWIFEAALAPGAVKLEMAERDVLLEQAGRVVTLLPAENLRPGRRLNMTVRFDDGAAPARATFGLVVHPARAHRQVEVFRHRRTVESYQQALRTKEAEARQCHEDNAKLRTTHGRLDGLRGLFSAKLMGRGGVEASNITFSATVRPGGELAAWLVDSYRSEARVAVAAKLRLTARAGVQPWEAEGAALVGPGGRELPVLGVWQMEPISTGTPDGATVVVEAAAQAHEAQGAFTLKLWDSGGTRTVTIDGVTFPQLP